MTIEEMLYEFDLSTDNISSKRIVNLPVPAKITYLNRGQESFILNAYSGLGKPGFEENQKTTEQLQILHVTNEKCKVEKRSDTLFLVDLLSLKQEKLLVTDIRPYCSKGECRDQIFKAIVTQTDDLDDLKRPFKSPNFNWRRLIHRTANNKLELYTDGSFTVSQVIIDYLRRPSVLEIEGYERFDGTASENKNCELPVLVHSAIVSEAAMQLKMDTSNPNWQLEQLKGQTLK